MKVIEFALAFLVGLAAPLPKTAPPAKAAPTQTATQSAPAPEPAQGRLQAEKISPKTPYDSTQGRLYASLMQNLRTDFEAEKTRAIAAISKSYEPKYASDLKPYQDWHDKVCKDNDWDPKTHVYDYKADQWYVLAPVKPVVSTKGDAHGNVVVDGDGKTVDGKTVVPMLDAKPDLGAKTQQKQ